MKKEEMKQEALSRMSILQMHTNAIEDFEKGILNRSEGGMLYWLTDDEKDMIMRWEAETCNLAYHVIKDQTSLGLMYSILYVSPDKEEWVFDRKDLVDGYPLSYVVNQDDPDCSDYGSIKIMPRFGGVIRLG